MAQDCEELGIVDVVVQESLGGAHTNPDESARQLSRALLQELAEIQRMSRRRLVSERYKKFRKMGEYSSHFRAAITREVDALQGAVVTGVKRIARRRSASRRRRRRDPLSNSPPKGERTGTKPPLVGRLFRPPPRWRSSTSEEEAP